MNKFITKVTAESKGLFIADRCITFEMVEHQMSGINPTMNKIKQIYDAFTDTDHCVRRVEITYYSDLE